MSEFKPTTLNVSDGSTRHLWYAETSNAKADVLFCHGLNEHAGRYSKEAALFNQNGIGFYSYDLLGHGKSDGQPRCHISIFNDHLQDLDIIKAHFGLGTNRPFFLLGHSMGGLIVLSYLMKYGKPDNLNGVMLSAPLIMPVADMAPILQKLSGVVAALLPKLRTVKLDADEISSDPEEVRIYMNDPLICQKGITAGTGYCLLAQMKYVQDKLSTFNYPFIVQHSRSDRLTAFEGSELLYAQSVSKDKAFTRLSEEKHEILKDRSSDEVIQRYIDWIGKHL